MRIRFYNTLTRQLDDFAPLEPPSVYIYTCGPTVYDYAHIGNFRTFVFEDVLRRFLELAGYNVYQVMNLTDVGHMTEDQSADGGGEDKMQVAARRLKEAKKSGNLPPGAVGNPDDPYQIAEYYIQAFLQDAGKLGLKIAEEYPARMPRATEHVPQMIRLIEQLLANGHAYLGGDGAVYFSVESFPAYGKLSGNTLDKFRGLRIGAGGRILEQHQSAKRHPADFLLWKPDPSHIMKWDSPWGAGYPGWHIECSAMAMELLGRDVLDIHCGGEDNIFPHHECEIAQSCASSGQEQFAHFWMHARYLLVEGEKMSKSKGNFFTLRDIVEGKATQGRPVDPAVVRYELLKGHYRSNVNFTVKGLEDSGRAVAKLREAAAELEKKTQGQADMVDLTHPLVERFASTLADDLNVSGGLGEVFKWIADLNEPLRQALGALRKVDSVLQVLQEREMPSQGLSEVQANAICVRLDAARQAKDFNTADRLRQELAHAGYEVRTTKQGSTAHRKLA